MLLKTTILALAISLMVSPIAAAPLLPSSSNSVTRLEQRAAKRGLFGKGKAKAADVDQIAKAAKGISKKVFAGGLIGAAAGGAAVGGGIVYGVEEYRHRPTYTKPTVVVSNVVSKNLTDVEEQALIDRAEAHPDDEQAIIDYLNQFTDVDQARKDGIIAAVRAAAAKSRTTSISSVPTGPSGTVASIESLDDTTGEEVSLVPALNGGKLNTDQQWGSPLPGPEAKTVASKRSLVELY